MITPLADHKTVHTYTSFTSPMPEIRAGSLEVRLALNLSEINAAQQLRYHVFVDEVGAHPTEEGERLKRDFDEFDDYCDHLLVIDHGTDGQDTQVVGTYRLLRRQPMRALGRFYTQGEFDISPIVKAEGEILELGRSCVHPSYRNRAVMQLLWRGLASYIDHYRIELMFGCGSLYGADAAQHKETLSYLYHYHLAPAELRIRALPERFVKMDWMDKPSVNVREAFSALPALIKGYLRLGGYVGEGAVIDSEYNTTDVGIIVKTEQVTQRYVQRYAQGTFKENPLISDSE